MPTPANSNRQGLVVYAKNKKRVSAFYRQTLDLVAIEEEPAYDLLRGPGVEVVIHAIPPKYASEINITQPPKVREETPLKPTFFVRSLEAVRIAAESTGGALKPSEAAWQYNGAVILDGCDPEGNVVQFRQHGA